MMESDKKERAVIVKASELAYNVFSLGKVILGKPKITRRDKNKFLKTMHKACEKADEL